MTLYHTSPFMCVSQCCTWITVLCVPPQLGGTATTHVTESLSRVPPLFRNLSMEIVWNWKQMSIEFAVSHRLLLLLSVVMISVTRHRYDVTVSDKTSTRDTRERERECVCVCERKSAHVVPCPKITANQTFCSSSGRTGQSGGGPLVTEQLPWLMPVIWLWHPWRRRARLAGSAVVSDGTRRSGPPGRIRTAAKMPPTLFQKLFNKRSALSPPPQRCNREDPAFR